MIEDEQGVEQIDKKKRTWTRRGGAQMRQTLGHRISVAGWEG